MEYYNCTDGLTQYEAGEVVFSVQTDNSVYDTLRVEINASGPIFVFHACDTDSLVTYCIGGTVCIDNVIKGTSFIVIMDWLQDHTFQWDFDVNCYPYYPGGENCDDPIELTGSVFNQPVCTAGHIDDYGMMASCGLNVPGADVVYKLCLAPGGELAATLQTECVHWSAMYLFTDCVDPSGSCVSSAASLGGGNLPSFLLMNYVNGGGSPQELFLAVDNQCDTYSSYDFGGRLTLSVDYDPCAQEEKGACCFSDGSCDFLSLDNCFLAGGEFQGVGTTCDPNPCDATGIKNPEVEPRTGLMPAMPNPFSKSTFIRYYIERPVGVRIDIYDVLGRVVRRLESRHAAAGLSSVEWNGRNDAGSLVVPGVYFCRMETDGIAQTRRIVLIR